MATVNSVVQTTAGLWRPERQLVLRALASCMPCLWQRRPAKFKLVGWRCLWRSVVDGAKTDGEWVGRICRFIGEACMVAVMLEVCHSAITYTLSQVCMTISCSTSLAPPTDSLGGRGLQIISDSTTGFGLHFDGRGGFTPLLSQMLNMSHLQPMDSLRLHLYADIGKYLV